MRCGAERSGASGSDDECEDTPSRHHATTTPYNPSPPQRTTTHVTTQLKTLRSLVALWPAEPGRALIVCVGHFFGLIYYISNNLPPPMFTTVDRWSLN